MKLKRRGKQKMIRITCKECGRAFTLKGHCGFFNPIWNLKLPKHKLRKELMFYIQCPYCKNIGFEYYNTIMNDDAYEGIRDYVRRLKKP